MLRRYLASHARFSNRLYGDSCLRSVLKSLRKTVATDPAPFVIPDHSQEKVFFVVGDGCHGESCL